METETLTDHRPASNREQITHWVQHAAHLLPSQGPIKVFVHHNTLHSFEHDSFDVGVLHGLAVYGCEPYWSEERFRQEMPKGRIRIEDIANVLMEDLGDEADRLIASFGTRFELRLAMMKYPLRSLPERELMWFLSEGGALQEFLPEVPAETVRAMTEATRKDTLAFAASDAGIWNEPGNALLRSMLQGCKPEKLKAWTEHRWRRFTLNYLWNACREGVERIPQQPQPSGLCIAFGSQGDGAIDSESIRMVNELLIPFCASYLDQGFAAWSLPDRDLGFLKAFCSLYASRAVVLPEWLSSLPAEIAKLQAQGKDGVQLILSELQHLPLDPNHYEKHIEDTLLELRGWAGMIWQMETTAPWTPKPAPAGSLIEYVAIRLMLRRLANRQWVRERERMERTAGRSTDQLSRTTDSIAFRVFQMAQFRNWSPRTLCALKPFEWKELLSEVDWFHGLERRRIFQLAYERHYRIQALDAVSVHSRHLRSLGDRSTSSTPPKFQVITCIDDREESFRRHLEEVEPKCETYGAAGFFAVVMYYRGAAEAHYRPLCPINIVPKHFVCEEPVFSAESESGRRSQRRKLIGKVSHRVHSGSRTIIGGVVTGLLGSLATFPLVARVLAPHITSRIRDHVGGFVRPPATELHLERNQTQPGPDADSLGYTISEMAGIVVRLLQDIGLTSNFSPIVLFLGHGSSSLNNPHESAYNCGACSGGRGGPNARAFASMANDPRVRAEVAKAGIRIPESVRFIGGYHNTCNDRVEYYDLDRLPWQHRPLFREMQSSIDETRARNAQERIRRFESARLGMSPADSLRHVEERSEDLSQARPEYNHATNALCFVGQREWSRGLFLDRRAFLASYDPSIDDERGTIVERILQAAIPVCGGISLEYYFSTVDPEGYGSGSKLPHNIASLAGVMTGAASDLRPGLSAQMVEIHEPLRILFVVQTTPTVMKRIIQNNEVIRTLVEGEWVQLSLFDSATSQVLVYHRGEFKIYEPTVQEILRVPDSRTMVVSDRGHLPFATIDRNSLSQQGRTRS
jgi:uncharacterized protein YbcC (UPF0753/DUF2309 family)